MFNRRNLPECRHTVGFLVGSEVTVVSAASVCYPFLLVPPSKGPYTPPTSIGYQRLTGVHPVSFTGGLMQMMKQQNSGEWQPNLVWDLCVSPLFKKGYFCFCFICKSLCNSAWQLLYHTLLRLSDISHISVRLGIPQSWPPASPPTHISWIQLSCSVTTCP